MSWQTSQSVAAELHRRLHRSLDRTRRTVADARKRGVLASRLPFRPRHKTLLGLRYRIIDIERTGERIGRAAIEGASPLVDSVDDSIARINTRLDQVDEAKHELRELGGNA
jgi:tRNA (Thr-GGU) A37 N-methylase